MVIKLNEYQEQKSKVFSGRTLGKSLRLKLDLDKYDNGEEEIVIEIPDETISINSSFFLGLLSESIIYLGEEKFRKKYKFICKNQIMEDVDDGIKKALKRSNVLD